MMRRPKTVAGILGLILITACTPGPPPITAAGHYRLDYSGVYGTGRIELMLQDGQVSALGVAEAGLDYRGSYRQAQDRRQVQVDLIVHLPPTRQIIDGVAIVGTAREMPVQFTIPANLDPGARWPIRIETQVGPIRADITRLP
ncbi:hypothetical protein [Dongia rigui]|uniref:Late embryogenesis abundant protein LEA-2 subgroup domain-containing protein n=1 Tax=Dongia rigui TaxID=940149 RepID=A0ABU5DZX6_9PROT|nr:hypothetical protein [Dongia rigui]MDY0872193.1 hypothetical protein [Dongia rigui]